MKDTEQANSMEKLVRDERDYEFMVSCANAEDEDGMVYLGRKLGHPITQDTAWTLIERYQTKGNAY